MLHHFATRTDTGPVVAYIRPDTGTATVAMECPSQERAEAEAARMNREAAQERAQLENWRRRAGQCKRRARWFPNEDGPE